MLLRRGSPGVAVIGGDEAPVHHSRRRDVPTRHRGTRLAARVLCAAASVFVCVEAWEWLSQPSFGSRGFERSAMSPSVFPRGMPATGLTGTSRALSSIEEATGAPVGRSGTLSEHPVTSAAVLEALGWSFIAGISTGVGGLVVLCVQTVGGDLNSFLLGQVSTLCATRHLSVQGIGCFSTLAHFRIRSLYSSHHKITCTLFAFFFCSLSLWPRSSLFLFRLQA